ncbi:MAG: glycosyltransferase family 2 protein [Blautia sp.]|nr:glycosyltransferase family 2 protein [Lachnoclostridium sp.]MCM1212013.1 glycosyltransferase family 2 protein [Blautia sp.]
MVLQSSLKVQVLVSAVNGDMDRLPGQMHMNTDAVIVNQCDSYGYREYFLEPGTPSAPGRGKVQCFSMKERGVGLSRNTALLHADTEVCLFSDEDIVLSEDYEKTIQDAYRKYPDADMILFNVRVVPARRTYWNEQDKRIRWYNYGRYPAYSISGKLESFRRANVSFSLLFGGGAKYSNGEDSLFLHDCIQAGLKIYAVRACIGEEIERESTWFHGYTDKFFRDRGVLYHYLYGNAAGIFALRFLMKNKREMCVEIPFREAHRLMRDGIRSQR